VPSGLFNGSFEMTFFFDRALVFRGYCKRIVLMAAEGDQGLHPYRFDWSRKSDAANTQQKMCHNPGTWDRDLKKERISEKSDEKRSDEK